MNMRLKNYTICLILCLAVTSCKKGFQELNVNPNTSEKALPQALLAPAIASIVTANMSRSQRLTNELMQVTVDMGDTDGKIFRYDIRKSEGDYLWNSWYLELSNFNDIYKGAEQLGSNSFKGISLICQAYVFSLLTDTYGDIPYFNATKAKEGVFMPEFDRQEVIYPELFKKLEMANELLKTGTNIPSSSDPLYAGNAANWRKFGNTLYLRLLLRVSAKSPALAVAKIKDIVDVNSANYPVISSNAESAALRWSGTAPYVSPFATWRPADWYTPKLADFFVNNLKEWGDPRIAKWATIYNGKYEGIPSGYPVGQAPEGKSTLPVALQSEPLLGNILNYAELQFLLAEAASKGWITTGTAKGYYENGVTSGITYWGYAVPENYLQGADVKWTENLALENKLELIHLQKYYSLFMTDLEQWFEYRRTGHPQLPKGAGLPNGGQMPSRLNYPVYLQSTNSANYAAAVAIQGADDLYTKVWWQKP